MVDNNAVVIFGVVVVVGFTIVIGVISYFLWKQRKQRKALQIRLLSSSNAKDKFLDDNEGEERYNDLRHPPAGAESFLSLRSENLNMFNPAYRSEGDETDGTLRDISEYDNIQPSKPTAAGGATGGNLHRSVRNMSVRYERGKEITQIVPGNTQGDAPPKDTWRNSAYEDIEEQSFVPPVRTLSDAAVVRGQVPSVCYETFEDSPMPPPPSDPVDDPTGIVCYENLEEPKQPLVKSLPSPSSQPPPPSQPSPPSEPPPSSEPPSPSEPPPSSEPPPPSQPPPPSEPPPPSQPPPPPSEPPPEMDQNPFDNAGMGGSIPVHADYENTAAEAFLPEETDSEIPTASYENVGDQKPPVPNQESTVNDPRGAVVSVCYEMIEEQEPPNKEDPNTANPFDYREESVPSDKANHLSMYEDPEEYSDATLRKARDMAGKTAVAEATEKAAVAEVTDKFDSKEDGLPQSISAYQTGQESLDAGMSDISMRSRTLTIGV